MVFQLMWNSPLWNFSLIVYPYKYSFNSISLFPKLVVYVFVYTLPHFTKDFENLFYVCIETNTNSCQECSHSQANIWKRSKKPSSFQSCLPEIIIKICLMLNMSWKYLIVFEFNIKKYVLSYSHVNITSSSFLTTVDHLYSSHKPPQNLYVGGRKNKK